MHFQTSYRVSGSLTDVMIETHRRKHLAYLMADQGALVNPESSRNLPKQVPHESSLYRAAIAVTHSYKSRFTISICPAV